MRTLLEYLVAGCLAVMIVVICAVMWPIALVAGLPRFIWERSRLRKSFAELERRAQ